MALPVSRPRSSGGLSLIMLGIVLALATGVLVLYLTNSGGGSALGGIPVIVASRNLNADMVLAASPHDTNTAIRISDAFHVQHVPASILPDDYFPVTSQADLEKALDGQVVTAPIQSGDILRKADPRIGPFNSHAFHDPKNFPDKARLVTLHLPDTTTPVEGDHIDILATVCKNGAANSGGCQITQLTLQNLLVYQVLDAHAIMLALSPQDAINLDQLEQIAKIDIVIRKPGDNDPATTQAIDPATLFTLYHIGS